MDQDSDLTRFLNPNQQQPTPAGTPEGDTQPSFDDLIASVPDLDLGYVDLSDIPDKIVFDVWARGDYDGVVLEAEEETSKAGNPMVKWTVEVVNPDTGKKRKMFLRTVTTQENIARFIRSLKAAVPEVDLHRVPMRNLNPLVANRPVTVRVDIGRYQNENRNEIKELLPARQRALFS